MQRSFSRALSPKNATGMVRTGAETALGWAGVNFMGALENRLGVQNLTAALPGGAHKIVGYLLKIVNVGLVGVLANALKLGARTKANLAVGGVANLGVNLLADVAGMFGASGESFRGLLRGHGDTVRGLKDYVLYGQPYSTAMGPGGLSDWRGLDGQMSMGLVAGEDAYGSGAYG